MFRRLTGNPPSPGKTKGAHSRKRNHALAIALTVPVVISLVLATAVVVAWQFDERNHKGRVARSTSVSGTKVSGQTEAQLRTSLTALQTRLRTAPVEFGHDKQRFTAAGDAFGLDLNIEGTAQSIMRDTHDRSAPTRFGRFIHSHFGTHEATPIISFDSSRLASIVTDKDPGPRTQPTSPTIKYEAEKFVAVKGVDGSGLVNGEAPNALRAAVRVGFPVVANVPTGVIPSLSSTDDLNSIIAQAEKVTAAPLQVTAGGKSGTLKPEQLKPLMRAMTVGDHLQLDTDSAETQKTLEAALPQAGVKVVEAGYDIQNGVPVPIDGKSGTVCCDAPAPTLVGNAIVGRLNGADPAAAVDLPLKTVQPKNTKENMPDLGIKEVISTFTTNHPANQPRVANIHLIADLTRGMIVKPGETFSINNAVGQRTTEKGFVIDHVIEDGKFAESVGGGISQYATTLFNAGFFGGLDFGEYQSHSIYIDRYPYGREATVSFPHPDMQLKNTTPYGVLVWPTYTGTSLTVTLYSTKYASGEQTNQSTQPSGNCTRVRTERTRTYVDGHTSVDSVSALYQPKEGEKC